MIDSADLLAKVRISEAAVNDGLVTRNEAAILRNFYVNKSLEPICERLIDRYIMRSPSGHSEASNA
jgi:hypothetical protein